MGFVGIIADNKQFVSYYRLSIPQHVNVDFVTQSMKQMSEHVAANILLLVGFVGRISHNEQIVVYFFVT